MQGSFLFCVDYFWLNTAACGTSKPIFPLSIFPNNEQGCGIENGGVGTAENAHEQNDHEMTDAFATKESQSKQGEHHCQLCINRTVQCLNDGVIDQRLISNAAVNV